MRLQFLGLVLGVGLLLSGCQDESDSGEAQASEAGSNLIAQTSTSTVAPACSNNTFVLAGVVRFDNNGLPVRGSKLGIIPIQGGIPKVAPPKEQSLVVTLADTQGGFIVPNLPLTDYYLVYQLLDLTAEPSRFFPDARIQLVQAEKSTASDCTIIPANQYGSNCDGWLVQREGNQGMIVSLWAGARSAF